MADDVDPSVPDDPAGADLPHPDPVTEPDAESGHDVDDHAHGVPDHGHGHDDHGHGDHGHDAPADDRWVLLPVLVGIVIGIVVAVVFGLATDAAPFV